MTMQNLKFAGSGHAQGAHSSLSGSFSGLKRGLMALGSGLRAVGESFKVAQLASAMNRMSDYHLAEIGVERRDIYQHAERLIAAEKNVE